MEELVARRATASTVGHAVDRPVNMEPSFRVERIGPRSLRLLGELDLSSVDELGDALAPLAAEEGDITLELSELSFIDSTGIRLLLQTLMSLKGKGQLVLASPTPHVARVLELMGLGKLDGLAVVKGRTYGPDAREKDVPGGPGHPS